MTKYINFRVAIVCESCDEMNGGANRKALACVVCVFCVKCLETCLDAMASLVDMFGFLGG